MSSPVPALSSAPEGAGARASRPSGPSRSWQANGDSLLGLAIAAALTLLAFTTTGGVALGADTWAQIVLVVLGAGLGIALLVTGPRRPASGVLALALFAAVAALTFASIAWSVQPANSWLEANRTLSYLAAFGSAMALARLLPGRGRALVAGVGLYTVIVAVYALLTKVFPATMDAGDSLARVRAPFDYYNATGLVAAMGIPVFVWLGARREGSRALAASSVPALAALVCTLILSYGRGALGATVIALAVWFGFVGLRLRAALVLAAGTVGGLVAAVWATRQSALANDKTPLAARVSAGHHFGLVLLVVLVLTAAAGWGVTAVLRRPTLAAAVRRRIGLALIAGLALVPLAGLGALATSSRGFGGEVSHLWNSLTNPNGFVLDQPGRLSQLGSSRPRYWRDGLRVGEHAALAGTGAFGFATAVQRYSPDRVLEAHSYIVQTFADFGVIGLVVNAGLLIAWILATRRTLRRRASEDPDDPERAARFTLLAVAICFGVHSTIDWTWFIPGAAVPAIACAGWLAASGARGEAPATRRTGTDALRIGGAVALGVLALVTAWIVYQPLRSANADAAAVGALVNANGGAALTDARTAVAADPVDYQPHQYLSEAELATGDITGARAELVKATEVQPDNPVTWQTLAVFDANHGRPVDAQREQARATALAPYAAGAG